MIIKIAEYKVKKDALEKVLKAIRVFVNKIHKHEPKTFYEAYRRSDLEFTHLMKFPNTQAEEKHASSPYTEKFVNILYPNCETEPVFTDLMNP